MHSQMALVLKLPLVPEISYQINDSGAKVLFAAEDVLDKVLDCSRKVPGSRVYLLTTEKKDSRGIPTLGDLLDYGEMEWERITDKNTLQKRYLSGRINWERFLSSVQDRCFEL